MALVVVAVGVRVATFSLAATTTGLLLTLSFLTV
jgi:hypothetical protein